MMRNKLLLGTAVLAMAAMSLTWAAGAQAAPMLQYQIYDGSSLIGSGSSASGTILNGAGSDANFSVALSASGSPFLTTPNFSTNNFTVSSGSAGGTLTIRVTDTGLTGFSGGLIANTFSLNSLNGAGFTSGTISNYFDNSNAAFGTGTMLGTSSFTGRSSFADQTSMTSVVPSGTFSETTVYVLNYAPDGNGTVSASSQLRAVPEPVSLSLLGVGLAGIGFARLRRKA